MGRPFWENPWWDDLPAMQERWQRLIAEAGGSGGPLVSEMEYALADGTMRHATGVRDDEGR